MRHRGKIIEKYPWHSIAGEEILIPIRMEREGSKVTFYADHDDSRSHASGPDLAAVIKAIGEKLTVWYSVEWKPFIRIMCQSSALDKDPWDEHESDTYTCSLSLDWNCVLFGFRDGKQVMWTAIDNRHLNEAGLWDGKNPQLGRWEQAHASDPAEREYRHQNQWAIIPLDAKNLLAVRSLIEQVKQISLRMAELFSPELITKTLAAAPSMKLLTTEKQ